MARGVPSQPGGSLQLALQAGGCTGWVDKGPVHPTTLGGGHVQRALGVPLYPFPRAGAFAAPKTRTGAHTGASGAGRASTLSRLVLIPSCPSQVVARVARVLDPGCVLGTAEAEASAFPRSPSP